MKGFASLLGLMGVLVALYSIVGRFVGSSTIGFGIVVITAKSGLILANTLILVAILMKSSK